MTSIDTTGTEILPATDGIVRVFVPAHFGDNNRAVARSAACKAWGNVAVGRTPTGKPTSKPRKGWLFDFAPISVQGRPSGRRSTSPATPSTDDAKPDEQLAALKALGISDEQAVGILALFGTATPTSGAARKPRRASSPAKCDTCADLGLVRNVGDSAYGVAQPPAPGKRPAWQYKTARGALAAKANGHTAKCPACKGGAKLAQARISAQAATA